MKRWILVVLCLLPVWVQAEEVEVRDAWVRLPPPVADTAAAYLRLINHGGRELVLLGVRANVAGEAMFHGPGMRPLGTVRIPAGGEYRFAPGAAHVMLMKLKQPLHAGDSVHLVLRRAKGKPIQVELPVRDMRRLERP
ncbi:MAG: copper chaperone PCu(A)C [Zetaproteobacteria bacterium]|nr:MAG: copper chaperone PCu(A)C [Zetaproteobacteria bacterium]